MPGHKVMIRIMGESDIVDVEMTDGQLPHELLMGLDAADRINMLGHWMDQDRGAGLAEQKSYLEAMAIIASAIVQKDQHAAQLKAGGNFTLVTLLREKWPVGSKAKFKKIADRVKAEHTYLAHVCAVATIDDLNDQDALKQAETNQLSMALPFYRANRTRFANSSAVQGLIRS
jgi:hypothetical protein